MDDQPFRVEIDCSQYAMGGILSQLKDGKWHPVAYRSQCLSETKQNYEIHDRELLAIMRALEDWRLYLLGAVHKFEIWTDHQNLTYFRQPHKLNRRQARWHTELQEYNFTLIHKPGRQMTKADTLSRMAELQTGLDDNKDVTVLQDSLFVQSQEQEHVEEGLMACIRAGKGNLDEGVAKKLRDQEPGWIEEDGVIYWQGGIYIPKDSKLRGEIIQDHHDPPTSGHPR